MLSSVFKSASLADVFSDSINFFSPDTFKSLGKSPCSCLIHCPKVFHKGTFLAPFFLQYLSLIFLRIFNLILNASSTQTTSSSTPAFHPPIFANLLYRPLFATLRIGVNHWKLNIRPDKCHPTNLSYRLGECDDYFNHGLINWVSELKFLGFIVARCGGFNKHTSYLRRKVFSKLNILKVLPNKNYRARSLHLVTQVRTTICPLADYGAALLAKTCNSLFKQLQVIQTSASHLALFSRNVLRTQFFKSMPTSPNSPTEFSI